MLTLVGIFFSFVEEGIVGEINVSPLSNHISHKLLRFDQCRKCTKKPSATLKSSDTVFVQWNLTRRSHCESRDSLRNWLIQRAWILCFWKTCRESVFIDVTVFTSLFMKKWCWWGTFFSATVVNFCYTLSLGGALLLIFCLACPCE